MIHSLRFLDARDRLCDSPPTYIRLWGEILGSRPAATSAVQAVVPVQMRALARAKIQWSDGRVIRLPKETDLEYSRFGLTRSR